MSINNGTNHKARTLSLCVIYGNESAHIERFMKSFAVACEEMVFVRAIGANDPDDTKDRIDKVAEELSIKVIHGEYFNAEETKHWKHVDRFDKARQMAFDLATCDLRMWADCDDVLPLESVPNIDQIKNSLTEDVFFCKYELPDMDHGLLRERIVGRIPMRWGSPVHEAMVLPPNCSRLIHEGVIIEHRPVKKEGSSVERNLKILKHFLDNPDPEDWEPALWFYYHRDNYYHPQAIEGGHLHTSVKAALKAISYPNLGQVEKYECLVNLAAIIAERLETVKTANEVLGIPSCGDLLQDAYSRRELWLLNALRCDPSRREAVAGLAVLEIDRKAYPRALSYCNIMRGIPEPVQPPWTHRRAFYQWKGALLQTQCLRYNNREADARVLEDGVFEKCGRYLSICHATRRGKKALELMYLWLTMAENAGGIEWIFAVDEDDTETQEALKGYRTVIVPAGKGPVAAWNAAAKAATGKVLVQMSDDWIPVPKWDYQILGKFGNKLSEEAVLRISDGNRKDDLMCMAILTKRYHDRYGYMFHPEYFSMYSDNEFTWQAEKDGVIIEAQDVVFIHAHPIFNPDSYANGKIKEEALDDVYKRSNDPENYKKGLEIFERHKDQQIKGFKKGYNL